MINAMFLSNPMKLVDVLPAKEKKTVTILMGMKADFMNRIGRISGLK